MIDVRLYTSEMQRMKPHPEVFHEALAAVGVDDPARAVFVGDRPLDDIAGAKGVGMRAVLRRHPYAPASPDDPEPDAAIDDLAELAPLIEIWSSGVA